MAKPLLRSERCERRAALGAEVVPEVNWMLAGEEGVRAVVGGGLGA